MRASHHSGRLAAATLLVAACCARASARSVHHYVFFNRERGRIADPSFLETRALEGAQLKYTWRELEPEKDRYDFRAIRRDLAFLTSHGKKLFIQLQDSSFDDSVVNVPKYLLRDSEYHGGAARQYEYKDGDEAHAAPAGWVARRWDSAVRERFQKLFIALGREFDGKIEGINLPETAVDFGESGGLWPPGFTPERYRDAVLATMDALRQAFPESLAMQYANFMPGEWLPSNDHSFLRSIYEHARDLRMAVGGPDLLPYKPAQMNHDYRFMHEFADWLTIGIAVQEGNYELVNQKTGRRVTILELADFATGYLRATYIFWCTQEPYYSERVIPFLKASGLLCQRCFKDKPTARRTVPWLPATHYRAEGCAGETPR